MTGRPVAGPTMAARIAGHVRERLNDGRLKPGDRVLITELADRYDVSRDTAARAVRSLAQDGRLDPSSGLGYLVPDAE